MGRWHQVAQGECLSSLAERFGFEDWRTIYDHPRNEELRRQRPSPGILAAGDEVFVPSRSLRQAGCPTDRRTTFVLRRPVARLRILLRHDDGEPLARAPYRLQVMGKVLEGETGRTGLLDRPIPADADRGHLAVLCRGGPPASEHKLVWDLDLGHLDPISDLSGVQARLRHLGFACGAVDGTAGPLTDRAVRRFQRSEGLPERGLPCLRTLEALVEAHGC